ncbi:MAG TPA: lipopolysaccharide heptosyltransferase II [Oligoflexia bacterium]|nr:lipopolysaccharide heptosyltransferase II [Oligoflexia bacterium]HMP47372.1 lipopolysaccharide heptosyltransferase II [Oligoflexia bacterium]
MQPSKANNILLVQLGFLGDVVLSTPVIGALRKIYPEAKIDFLCTKESSGLVSNHPELNSVITYDKRKKERGFLGLLRKVKDLRKNEYDAVFSLHKSYRTASLLWLSGIPKRFGFKKSSLNFLYTRTTERPESSHEVERNLAILKNIDIDPNIFIEPLRIGINTQLHDQANELIKNLPALKIAIAPGSVWRTKRWTKEGFSKISKELLSSGFGVVLIGGPSDMESGEFIEKSLSEYNFKDRFINTIGKYPLDYSCALIDACDALVTNDSAPLHIGSALNKPLVAIFCATVPAQGFGPWMVQHQIVERKELGCRPCGSHGGHKCPLGTDACQKEISPQEVLIALRSLIDKIKVNDIAIK